MLIFRLLWVTICFTILFGLGNQRLILEVVYYFANGDVGDWNEGEWGFANSQKTAIFVGEEEYEDIDILEISNLDESVFEGSNSYIEQGEQFVMEFVFTKVTN